MEQTLVEVLALQSCCIVENGKCSCTGWCISITASFLLFSLYSGDPTIEGYFLKDYCTDQTVKDLLAKYAVKVSKVSTRMWRKMS